ncbi:NADPH-dependent FMN reductase [Actinomadura xylanilytica]|uniref:NADPH-dependent FMN reductase n=1 Tax=Actinomadura xylanilytica TaxID=887459 RepID=UPI00255B00EE|nr:NAD(P)H-dependent oxidoreductase [Actinomadura xylanilytica]MDL4774384.1 NAD(P)H-dependent oxidoreductase [Actinomadura xylanilytica]
MTTVLMICGSLRAGSTNEAVLRTAADRAPDGVTATLFGGMRELPHFDPDDDHAPLHPAVTALRAAIEAADALLICTPEYAGALPGSFKNLLDWTVGGVETQDKPTAWINVASPAAPSGGADAHDSLRKVLRYTGADLVEAACARIPVTRDDVGPDGLVQPPATRTAITRAIQALAAHSRAPGTTR